LLPGKNPFWQQTFIVADFVADFVASKYGLFKPCNCILATKQQRIYKKKKK